MPSLHYALRVPEEGIGVEISSRVEPQVELLLSVAFALSKHICMYNVRITPQVSQELEINLIPV